MPRRKSSEDRPFSPKGFYDGILKKKEVVDKPKAEKPQKANGGKKRGGKVSEMKSAVHFLRNEMRIKELKRLEEEERYKKYT